MINVHREMVGFQLKGTHAGCINHINLWSWEEVVKPNCKNLPSYHTSTVILVITSLLGKWFILEAKQSQQRDKIFDFVFMLFVN